MKMIRTERRIVLSFFVFESKKKIEKTNKIYMLKILSIIMRDNYYCNQ